MDKGKYLTALHLTSMIAATARRTVCLSFNCSAISTLSSLTASHSFRPVRKSESILVDSIIHSLSKISYRFSLSISSHRSSLSVSLYLYSLSINSYRYSLSTNSYRSSLSINPYLYSTLPSYSPVPSNKRQATLQNDYQYYQDEEHRHPRPSLLRPRGRSPLPT